MLLKKRIGIIGGGIIGLAVAYSIQRRNPSVEIVLLEKEDGPGRHQSGRNSGVLHCGLYYQPGSLKARLAVDGIRLMVDFCRKYKIPHELCGKVVVASDENEQRILEKLAGRGSKNGLNGLMFLNAKELKHREPYVKAFASLLVPEEGIVDYPAVMDVLALLIQQKGGLLFYNCKVTAVKENLPGGRVLIETSQREIVVDFLVCCAGLQSDRLYKSFTGNPCPLKIVPFRGEYHMLTPDAEKLVNHLVYPVPDPSYPFLGVHFTRLVHGGRNVGPNSVLSFKREGYRRMDFSLRDTLDSLTYPGFMIFLSNNLRFSARELYSSLLKKVFLEKAKKLIPDINFEHLIQSPAGVRAQAVAIDGSLVMDFRIIRHGSQVHILNAPSPGATASLAIADYIVDTYVHWR
jgi:(S)-2-hydroxyglutarate dehydrogenase